MIGLLIAFLVCFQVRFGFGIAFNSIRFSISVFVAFRFGFGFGCRQIFCDCILTSRSPSRVFASEAVLRFYGTLRFLLPFLPSFLRAHLSIARHSIELRAARVAWCRVGILSGVTPVHARCFCGVPKAVASGPGILSRRKGSLL
jgi:hypothetical protein